MTHAVPGIETAPGSPRHAALDEDAVPTESDGVRTGASTEVAESNEPSTLQKLGSAPAATALGAVQDPTRPSPHAADRSMLRKRLLLAGSLFAMLVTLMFPLVGTGVMTDTAPRDMKVALVGTTPQVSAAASKLQDQSAGAFHVSTVGTDQEARDQIVDRSLRAAYDPTTATLYTAGANGVQTATAVQTLFTQVAASNHQTLTVRDVAPLAEHDSIGSVALYLGLGVILGGLVAGVILTMLPVGSLIRLVVGVVLPAIVASVMLYYGWSLFNIYSGGKFTAWILMYLLGITCVAVSSGLLLTLGPAGLLLGMFLMPLTGITSSGITSPLDMISPYYKGMHAWVFSARGMSALRDTIYFPDAPIHQAVLTMLLWLVCGLALATYGTIRQKKRHLLVRDLHNAETAAAIAAATAL